MSYLRVASYRLLPLFMEVWNKNRGYWLISSSSSISKVRS